LMNATGKGAIAGRTARVAALLLLFGLLAPPGTLPCPAAAPGNPSARGERVGDNSAVLPRDGRVSERLFGLPGLAVVGRVTPGIFRGAQPEPEGYATLKAMGIRTVINVRQRHREREAVEAAGMRYVNIPISFLTKVDPAVVRKTLSVMTDPANQPVFIHCSVGSDRTGVVVAIYRMEVDGWSKAEAEAEMQTFGFHDAWVQMKSFVRSYRANARKGATP